MFFLDEWLVDHARNGGEKKGSDGKCAPTKTYLERRREKAEAQFMFFLR
jgi:hypothetical protein